MLEITNKTKGPITVMVRSKTKPRSFTTLRICGIGAGKNVAIIEDEAKTEYIDRVEKVYGLITTRHIPNGR
jgi:hypothetical protein